MTNEQLEAANFKAMLERAEAFADDQLNAIEDWEPEEIVEMMARFALSESTAKVSDEAMVDVDSKLEAVNIALEKCRKSTTDAEMFEPLCDLFDAGFKWFTDGDDFKTAQQMLRGAIREMEKPPVSDEAMVERAKLFHETYERLAPRFGYETREDTKEFDPKSPNGKLMIAVCSELFSETSALRKQVAELEGKLALTEVALLNATPDPIFQGHASTGNENE